MKISIACIVLCLSMPLESPGQTFNKGGRTAMQFLKIGVGARNVALGEASIAAVRDVNSVFWNPAGISGVGNIDASFSYTSWFADMNCLGGAVASRIPDIGVFGLFYTILDYGDIPEALVRSTSGASDTRTGSMVTGGDMLLGLSFAREFTDQLSIGVSVKFLQEKLFIYKEQMVAFDVGTHFDTKFRGIKFAMAAQNFSGSARWLPSGDREEGYDIPLLFRIGAAVDLVDEVDGFLSIGAGHSVTMSVDALHSNDYAERYHAGMEYSFDDLLDLRVGHKFNYEEGSWSFGIGLRQEILAMQVRVDYAYVDFQYLTSPHRVTLSINY